MIFAPFIFALACDSPENTLKEETTGREDIPIIRLEPAVVRFGELEAGASATDSFEIWNDGGVILEIGAVRIDASAQFTLVGELPISIPPGGSAEVEVVYTPTDVRAQGFALVDSNDPGTPVAIATLEGGGLYPQLGVRPAPVDFHALQPGCSRMMPITLSNIGGATLRIDTAIVVSDEFALGAPFSGPVSLEPGEETVLDMNFSPDEIASYDGALYVTSNEPAGVRTVPLLGEGSESPAESTDTFRQPDGPWDKTDVMIYIDQSCSMIDDQATLLANFDVFTQNLGAFASDYQIMFVTNDNGCHNLDPITPYTEDPMENAYDALAQGMGLATEKGFTITHRALAKMAPGECNEGFVRDGAKTILMMVSDEVEQSDQSWSYYVADFQSYAPTAAVVAVAGDYPDGCATAEPGVGYYEAAMATDGDFFSICASDWANYFEEISVLASDSPTDTFRLQWIPEVPSIAVVVDGARATAWTFDAAQNAVVFDALPAGGAWIEISYDVVGDGCE